MFFTRCQIQPAGRERPVRICAQENRLPREALIAHLCTGELNVACQLALCLRLRCENRVKNPEE